MTVASSTRRARFRASSLSRDIAALLAIAACGLAALRQYLFTGRALYWGDIELYFAPLQSLWQASVRRGVVPLWNPSLLCGEPYVGDPQTWPLYPSMLLGALPGLRASPWQFLTIDAALHLLLGGLLCYPLARSPGCRRWGAVLAGVVYMLGGYFVSKTQFPNMAQALAYTPAVIWLAQRLARRPGALRAAALGGALGLQLLAAHAQVSLMTGYLAAAAAAWSAWPRLRAMTGARRAAASLARLAGWGAAALAVAAALDAGELLPVLQVWRHSDRTALTLGLADRFVLHPGQIAGVVWPGVYGLPWRGDFHSPRTPLAPGNFWETACYVGVAPCALALAGATRPPRRGAGAARFWTAAVLVCAWLALGRGGGLYIAAFYALPGVKAFHDPARWLLGAALGMAVLAGVGLDAALAAVVSLAAGSRSAIPRAARRGAAAWLRAGVGAALVALAAVDLDRFDTAVYPLKPAAALATATRSAAATASAEGLLRQRVAFQPDNRITWRYFVDYADYRSSDPRYLPDLFSTLTSNTPLLLGGSDAGGYEPEPPRGAVRRYVSAYNALLLRGDPAEADALDIGTLVAFDPAARPGGGRRAGFYGRERRVVTVNPDRAELTAARWAGGYLPVRAPSPDTLVVSLAPRAGQTRAGGTIALAETDAPGWRAWLGTTERAVVSRPDGLMAVDVGPRPRAQHLVLRYEPSAWRVGLYVTLLTAGLLAGLLGHAVSSRVRPPAS